MITKRQKQVLDFAKKFIEKNGYSPSLEEIKSHLGLFSVSTAHHHVRALEEMGFLKREYSHPRSINILDEVVNNSLASSVSLNAFGLDTYSKIDTFINNVVEGDCLEIMKKIPSRSINMILCDLPYGTTQNKWDSVIPLNELWLHYERIIKEDGVIALTGQGLFSAQLILSNPKLFKYKIVWVKSKPTNFLNAKKQPLRKHEDVLIFYKNQPSYFPQMSRGEPYNKGFRKDQLTGSYGDFRTVEVKSDGERYPTDVVYFKTAESEGPVFHPTQKPVELGRYLIRTFTNSNDIVLDNTCGSGSFLVSAVLEDRRFIGIEKNEEVFLFKHKRVDYIEVCRQRIREAQSKIGANNSQPSLYNLNPTI